MALAFGLTSALACSSSNAPTLDLQNDSQVHEDVTVPLDIADSRFDIYGEPAELCFTYDPGIPSLPAQAMGTPSAADGLVYQPVISFPSPNGQLNQLRAIDVDGQEVWSTDLSFVGDFVGPPSLDDAGNAFVLLVSKSDLGGQISFLTKVDRGGDVAWERDVAATRNGELPTRQAHLAVDADGGTYVVTQEAVVAIDQEGVERWRRSLPAEPGPESSCRLNRAWWKLLILEEHLYMTEPNCGTLRVALNGSDLLTYSTRFRSVVATLDGLLFGETTDGIASFDPRTGETLAFPDVFRLPAVFDQHANLYAHRREGPISSWSGLESRWTSASSANLVEPMTMLIDDNGMLALYNQYILGWTILDHENGAIIFERSIGRGVAWQFQPAVMLRAGEIIAVTQRDQDAGGFILTCVRVPIGLPVEGVWSSTGGTFRNNRRYTSPQ